jgi:hypothetical protein
MYTVYFGPPGSGEMQPMDREKWPSKSFVDLSSALLWAHGAAGRGTVIVRIDGGGLALDRSEIAGCLNALAIGGKADSHDEG